MVNRFGLEGQSILVVGAGGGMGSVTAESLASAGASVILSERERTPGAKTAREVRQKIQRAGGRARFVPCNILSDRSCASAMKRIADEGFELTGIAFLAGAVSTKNILTGTPADLLAQVDLHVCSLQRLIAPVLPRWIERRSGTVIAMTSVAGDLPAIGKPLYSASKGAANTLLLALAAEYGRVGLRFVPVLANRVGTPSALDRAARSDAFRDEMLSTLLSGKWITPDEVAAAFTFLFSPAARPINGAKFPLDDGAFSALSPRPVPPE